MVLRCTSIYCMIIVTFVCVTISVVFHITNKALGVDVVVNSELPEFLTSSQSGLLLTEVANNLVWFVQLTDLHISKFGNAERLLDLKEFSYSYIPIIRPDLVIVSGDITDGKFGALSGPMQHQEEWEAYSKLIRESGVLNMTTWLDVRGNHDTFGVSQFDHHSNLFSIHGAQGHLQSRIYSFTLRKKFGNYSFVGLDVCLNPGVKWPLNFFGFLSSKEVGELKRLLTNLVKSNQTFWFGHHPTSTIVSPDFDLRGAIGQSGFAYLCGHLHTFHGLAPRMYALQSQQYWELELGDWKVERYFRIVAVDHDIVSFVDLQLPSNVSSSMIWPIIIITNPKDARFLLPSKEPLHRISSSSHIRILVWSRWQVMNVSVSIDGVYQGEAKRAIVTPTPKDPPLFVLPWNPSEWKRSASIHIIEVVAKDTFGNHRTVTQPFLIEGTISYNRGSFSSLIIRGDQSIILRLIFYGLWTLCVTLLVLPRLLRNTMCCSCLFRNRLGLGMYRVANTNRLFYPILFYFIYELCGPIFMGYLVGDHFGVVFSFGIYVAGTFLPESLTYMFETYQILLFSLWLLLFSIYCGRKYLISRTLQKPVLISEDRRKSATRIHLNNLRHNNFLIRYLTELPVSVFVLLIIFTLIEIILSFKSIWLPYGFTTSVLCPGRVIPIIVMWVLTCYFPYSQLLSPTPIAN